MGFFLGVLRLVAQSGQKPLFLGPPIPSHTEHWNIMDVSQDDITIAGAFRQPGHKIIEPDEGTVASC